MTSIKNTHRVQHFVKNKRFHDCLNKPDLSGVDPEYVYAGIKRGYYPTRQYAAASRRILVDYRW
jgi:hypothetical protein